MTQRNRRTQRIVDYVRSSKSGTAFPAIASDHRATATSSSSMSMNNETSSLLVSNNEHLTSDIEQFQMNYHISDLKNK